MYIAAFREAGRRKTVELPSGRYYSKLLPLIKAVEPAVINGEDSELLEAGILEARAFDSASLRASLDAIPEEFGHSSYGKIPRSGVVYIYEAGGTYRPGEDRRNG